MREIHAFQSARNQGYKGKKGTPGHGTRYAELISFVQGGFWVVVDTPAAGPAAPGRAGIRRERLEALKR